MASIFTVYIIASLSLVLNAQIAERYRNPWVHTVKRHSCPHLECPFGETCDLSYQNCRPVGPCFVKEPTCVKSAGLPRPGNCPPPTENMLPLFTTDCFDDGGCGAPQICCHSYTSSYCWFPSARITARSLIPLLTNRSIRRITLNTTAVTSSTSSVSNNERSDSD